MAGFEPVEGKIIIKPNPGFQELVLSCPCTDMLVGGSRGPGKGLPLTAKIVTPWGFREMRDVKVGDMISNPDGGTAEVRGVYPQGIKQIYKITFADGATVRCDGEHLWLAWIANKLRKGEHFYLHNFERCDKMKVFSTEELIEKVNHTKDIKSNYNVLIPMPEPVAFNVATAYPPKIEPYLLGLLLGDGCITGGTISITNPEPEISDYLVAQGFTKNKLFEDKCQSFNATGELALHLKEELKKLKLLGTYSDTKFIPRYYLTTNIEKRIAILNGLTDTDGHVDERGHIEYTTTSEQLAKDVQFLVESLGGWATITSKVGSYTKEGIKHECKIAYRLYIQMPNKADVFSLPRKKQRCERRTYNNGNRLFRKIESIEPDGEEETVCIRVDHPNQLFMTDHFVVTHNTVSIVLACAEHGRLYGANARMIVFRESFPQLEDFLFNKCYKILPPLGWHYMAGRKTWVHPNGASIQLSYLESVEDAMEYQGREFTLVALEELGIMKSLAAADMLLGCLRSGAGVPVRFMATANPGGPCHDAIRARYIDPAPPMTPFQDPVTGIWRVYIPGTMKDNPQILENDPEYVNRLKGVGNARLVKAWLEGDWSISVKGEIFEREWFGFYDWNPEEAIMARIGRSSSIPSIEYRFSSWDTGCKLEEEHSKSAGITWAISEDKIFILDFWCKRVQFPDLESTLKLVSNKWKPHAVWIEERSSGIQLVQVLKRNTRLPVKGVQATKDKITRAHAVSTLVESRKVLLPTKCSWTYDLLEELCAFPGKGESDAVDAFTLGLAQIANMTERQKKTRNRSGRNFSIYGR